ncbi:hypothetical protein amb1090 [Paramagnetospirillum magneticum AMB-1]|uniref:Uncharacterized protein n=1 Tax=Paramagnetospirillum magneticum (strain ATCC 700264 / AMB-1) TaxID=342108 RepID=Q2W8D1_PARM1|nr:hypothetical protein amb1090 [Paramagnetospirillum magneticum AMB-1]
MSGAGAGTVLVSVIPPLASAAAPLASAAAPLAASLIPWVVAPVVCGVVTGRQRHQEPEPRPPRWRAKGRRPRQ